MSARCPKCGRNNYGDVRKCSFCGAPLTFIPGEEAPVVKEEEIQEKMAQIKVERIRNPFLIGAGGILAIIGIVLAVVLYLVVMFIVLSPTQVEPTYEDGAFHYIVPGGEEYIFGKITKTVEVDEIDWGTGGNHGYENHTAYEISGDGVDKRTIAFRDGKTAIEPDLWVYSDEELGENGDRILIKVVSKPNEFNEERAVSAGKAWWGGNGYLSGWILLVPGILLIIGGIVMAAVGFIGKADRSMERLLSEDKELRRQQLMLKEVARKQMEEKARQAQWTDYKGQQQMVLAPQSAVAGTPPGTPVQPPPAVPQGQAYLPQQPAQMPGQYQQPPAQYPYPQQQTAPPPQYPAYPQQAPPMQQLYQYQPQPPPPPGTFYPPPQGPVPQPAPAPVPNPPSQ